MEFRHLRYFVAVAEEGHVGRAAERLHMAQSPLSRQILQLEERIGVSLFEHAKKRVRLTEAGRRFLDEARRMLSDAESAVARTRRLAAGECGPLAVGFVDGAVHSGFLPTALRRLQVRHPDVRVALSEMRSTPQLEALRGGLLDVGFVYSPPGPEDADLASRPILRERLALALPCDHPLVTADEIRATDLDGAPWIALPRAISPGARQRFLAACAAAGFAPDVRFEAANIAAVLGLVGGGLGLTLAQASARHLAPPGVVWRELPWFALDVTIHVVRPAQRLRATAARFLDVLEETRAGR